MIMIGVATIHEQKKGEYTYKGEVDRYQKMCGLGQQT